MDVDRYLARIKFNSTVNGNDVGLVALHSSHVANIPFENIDIRYKRQFDLEIENIFTKVVINNRGGFCYELNLLFNELLSALGFQSRIIEARIFMDNGEVGPPFDHMAVLVETDKRYLADVGFGDLFLKPLEITEGIQSDGRNLFKIEGIDEFRYLLSMAKDDQSFEKKYVFDLRPVKPEDFHTICMDKQINPDSYFVKNLVCTKPTETGRVTIFNKNLIETRGAERLVTKIDNDTQLKSLLQQRFDIVLL